MYIEGEIPVTTNSGNNNSGFGNGWEGLIGLALVAGLFDGGFGGGFGGGNRGGFGGYYGGGFVTNDELQMGFFRNDVSDKLDGLNYGIADATFSLNNTITNGFSNVQSALCQGFSGVNLGLTTQGYETRSAITDLGYALKDCCCTTQRAIDGVNYNIATQFGGLNNTICGATRDIIENQNANYRALHDEIVANRIEDKNAQISMLQTKLNNAELRASQQAQSSYLLNELRNGCPVNAQLVCGNQPIPVQYVNACGCNNSCCGCNNF